MKKALAIIAVVLVAAVAAGYACWQWRGTTVAASVFVGARTCGVELKGAALIEAMRCAEVLPYLRGHLDGGANIALGYVGGRDDARAQELSAALQAAGYRLMVSRVVAEVSAAPR